MKTQSVDAIELSLAREQAPKPDIIQRFELCEQRHGAGAVAA